MDLHQDSDDEQPQEQSIRAIRRRQVKAPAKKKPIKKKAVNNTIKISDKLKEAVGEKLPTSKESQQKEKQPQLLQLQQIDSQRLSFAQAATVSKKVSGLQVVTSTRSYQPSKNGVLLERALLQSKALRTNPQFLRRLRKK